MIYLLTLSDLLEEHEDQQCYSKRTNGDIAPNSTDPI